MDLIEDRFLSPLLARKQDVHHIRKMTVNEILGHLDSVFSFEKNCSEQGLIMPAWPGGPCPNCSEDMPPNLVHCQTCRELLNSDLEHDTVEIPAFQPLKELVVCCDVFPTGYYFQCPQCTKELRVHKKYLGKQVSCNFCKTPIKLCIDQSKTSSQCFYTNCPHCSEELRVAHKYLGSTASCKFCQGQIQLLEKPADPVDG